jgi:hypothetical protein
VEVSSGRSWVQRTIGEAVLSVECWVLSIEGERVHSIVVGSYCTSEKVARYVYFERCKHDTYYTVFSASLAIVSTSSLS